MTVTLKEFSELASARSKVPQSLRKDFDEIAIHALGVDKRKEKTRTVITGVITTLFVGVALTTFVICVLGSLGVVAVDDKYFNRMWLTFGGSFIPLGAWLIRETVRPSADPSELSESQR